jgi:subtilisin-like proprotein convertase family protein
VFRYRSESDFDFLPVETRSAKGFNDAGDVVGSLDDGALSSEAFNGGATPNAFLYHDVYGVIRLDDVVVGTDAQFFRDATIIFGGPAGSVLTNRDATGFGSIFGYASVSTTTGSGRNKTTVTEQRGFILIPEVFVPPTPHTYSRSHIPGLAIPDAGTVTSTIEVPENDDFISDLNVTLNINHQRAQDLDVFLIGPGGTPRIELFTDVGGNGLNFVGTTLDDQATTSITSGSAPFTGSYHPEESLSAFNTLRTPGTWTLEVKDDKALKTGTLQSWSFTVEVD